MKWFSWAGRLSIPERAKREVDQMHRDLYDAERNQALWNKQCEFYNSEIARLTIVAERADAAKPLTNA